MPSDSTPPVLPIRADGTGPALVCVPPASGSPYGYLPLARVLGDRQALLALEAPGYDDGGPPAGSLPELSRTYLRALRAERPDDQAYCLLGWSMGGVVAYDMARRLIGNGIRVPALILVDTALPSALPPPTGRTEILRQFLIDLLTVSGVDRSAIDLRLASLPLAAGPARAFEQLIADDAEPDGVDAEFLLSRHRLFEAHVDLLMRYRVIPGYPARITVVRAGASRSGLMRWQQVAAEAEEHVIAGDHYSMWQGDGLHALGRAVRHTLARARE